MMYFGDELPEDEVHMEGELDDEDDVKKRDKGRREWKRDKPAKI
jgi:hypothetical protein